MAVGAALVLSSHASADEAAASGTPANPPAIQPEVRRVHTVVVLGNSIPYGGGLQPGQGFVSLLEQRVNVEPAVAGITFVNDAVPGQSTAALDPDDYLAEDVPDESLRTLVSHVTAEWVLPNESLDGYVFLVNPGSIDAFMTPDLPDDDFVDRQLRAITTVVHRLQSRGATVALTPVFPISISLWHDGGNAGLEQVQARLTALNAGLAERFPLLVEAYPLDFDGEIGGDDEFYDDFTFFFGGPDGIHLDPDGNRVVADALTAPLLATIESAGEPQVASLAPPATTATTPAATTTTTTNPPPRPRPANTYR